MLTYMDGFIHFKLVSCYSECYLNRHIVRADVIASQNKYNNF